jgi:peptidase E
VPPTIVAIGGGVLVEDRKSQQIEDYILALTGKADPRICFIPTASGEVPENIVRFYSVFTSDRCRPSHLTLIHRRLEDLGSFLLGQDIIWVGGGNTAAMLAIWRQHGVDEILRTAWERGIVLCGSSAGATLVPLHDGLSFIGGSFCPHYDVEVQRRPTFQKAVAEGVLPAGIAADNCVAVRYEDTSIAEFVSSSRDARAWRLEKTADGFSETEIEPRYLGAD